MSFLLNLPYNIFNNYLFYFFKDMLFDFRMSKITALHRINNIIEKMNMILEFIKANDYESKLIKRTSNTAYTIDDFVYASCMKDYFNYSYKKYEDAVKLGNLNLPSRSQLNRFVIKLAKYKILKQMHKQYIKLHPELLTEINSIDSSFIPNENVNKTSNFIGINSHYHNKFGCKITVIANDSGFPLIVRIDSGNVNDAKIGTIFINSITDIEMDLLGNIMLADSGYDSNDFKNELNDKNCSYIIPKNKRNSLDQNTKTDVETTINEINNNTKVKRDKIRESIKIIRTEIKNVDTERKKINRLEKISKLKEESKQLTIENKEKIKISKVFIKQQHKKKKKGKKEFNIGLTDEEKVIYKKRAFNEHIYTFFKSHRLDKVMYKTEYMMYHQIYSTILDKIMFIERKKNSE